MKNAFQWIGGGKSEMNAVHLETMMVQVRLVSHNMADLVVIETWLERISKYNVGDFMNKSSVPQVVALLFLCLFFFQGGYCVPHFC